MGHRRPQLYRGFAALSAARATEPQHSHCWCHSSHRWQIPAGPDLEAASPDLKICWARLSRPAGLEDSLPGWAPGAVALRMFRLDPWAQDLWTVRTLVIALLAPVPWGPEPLGAEGPRAHQTTIGAPKGLSDRGKPQTSTTPPTFTALLRFMNIQRYLVFC